MPDPDSFDLPEKYLNEVKRILKAVIPERRVWIYGSRVNGTSHESSDIDLVFFPAEQENTESISKHQPMTKELDLQIQLKEIFQESSLPLFVDILSWCVIPESFQDEIRSHHHLQLQ